MNTEMQGNFSEFILQENTLIFDIQKPSKPTSSFIFQ